MARLKEVCHRITDGSHNPPQGIVHSDYLMLSSKNIYDDLITFDEPRYLDEKDFLVEDRRTKVSPNDVLLTIVGTVGRVAVVPETAPKFCLQRSVAVIKPNLDKVVPRFLMYQLQNLRPTLEAEAKGVAQKGIYLKQVESLEIPLLPLDRQKEIVHVLDEISRLISPRKKQLQKLDDLVKSRFVEMFGDMTMNPNGWEKTSLGIVCDVRDGTHDSPEYYEEGYPLVTSKNVTDGQIDFTDCSLISKADYLKICERSKVDYGDILMPMIGTVGKPVIVNVVAEFAIKNVALLKFTKDSRVNNSFVQALLQSDYFDRSVLSRIRGGTQKFIALGDIRKLQVCVPPMKLQLAFHEYVNQTNKTKLTVQHGLDKLELLKQSLMQKYFG